MYIINRFARRIFSQFIKNKKLINMLIKSINQNSNTMYHTQDLIYNLYNLSLVEIDNERLN